MANEAEFQQQIRQLGELIAELEKMPDGALKVATGELIHLLMDVHRAGLERMMEIVFESDATGMETIDKLGRDPIVRSLLVLYSLHPDDIETRVIKSLDVIRPRLRKLNCTIELLSVVDGAVRLQIGTSGNACGSTTSNLRSVVEEGIYEFAPDITSLVIHGLDDQASSGFVTVESLAHSLTMNPHPMAMEGAD